MKIYTGYYFKIHDYKNVIPVSIAGRCPGDFFGIQYRKLAPKYWFFKKYKSGEFSEEDYIIHYNAEVLNLLNADSICEELKIISGNSDIILLCYEKPSLFCHRHLVAEWLTNHGYPTIELKKNN